jgi:uncharacterized coiled-coil protein SlyX
MSDEDRIAELEQRMAQLEKRASAIEKSRRAMSGAVPDQTRQHMRNAGREQLMALRTLLDHWIGRIDRPPDDERPSRETIPIE